MVRRTMSRRSVLACPSGAGEPHFGFISRWCRTIWGHSTPMLTVDRYGAFIPAGEDRERWERQVTRDQARWEVK